MKPLFLTDLDDTLFSAARKIKGVPIEQCEVASTLKDGAPSGYRTPQHKALQSLMSNGDVVPVTARSRSVLARCDIPHAPAICANGGVIIGNDGDLDPEWYAHMVGQIDQGASIVDAYERMIQKVDDGFRHWIVWEEDLPLYICFKSNRNDEDAIAWLAHDIEDEALPEDWKIHVNGNNLAVLPPWISKRAAVRHIIRRVRAENPYRLIIGVGDSLSDLGFMAECDFAMHPVDSQIGRHLAAGHKW